MVALIFSVIAVLLVVVGSLWACLSIASGEDSRWGDK